MSGRIERAAHQAAALELEAELTSLLGPDGLPTELGNAAVLDALRDVATRCDLLAHGAGAPRALRVLRETQARAYNALVQDAAAHGDAADVARGLTQLRHAADRLSALEVDGANAIGAYWRMLADLIDVNRAASEPRSRRAIARELFAHYIETFAEEAGDDPAAADCLADVRVGLARMLDEAGLQHEAVEALGELAQARPGDARYEQVRGVLTRHGRLGEAVAFELPSASGGAWSVADQADQPVLLHFYRHGVADSSGSVAALRSAIAESRQGGFAVVSIHLGALAPDQQTPPWPTLVLESGAHELLASLGVDTLPAYVWLDARGRVASIGRTLEVIRQAPQPEPEPQPEPVPADAAEDRPTRPRP